MPGLVSSEDIVIEVTADNRLVLHADLRGELKDNVEPLERKEVLREEWSAGPYHRELELPTAVDGERATVTYGNGVLVVSLSMAERTRPARLTLEPAGPFRGERVGSPAHPLTAAQRRTANAALEAEHGENPARRRASHTRKE